MGGRLHTAIASNMRTLFLALVLVVGSAAYTLLPVRLTTTRTVPMRRLSMLNMQVDDETEPPTQTPSEPPATSEDPPMDVDVEAIVDNTSMDAAETGPESFEPDTDDDDMVFEEGTIAKEALKSEIADGLTGGKPDKAVVGEILLALEAQNPTQSPATSALLNGKWKFLYASGASPGLKALMLLLRGAKTAPKSPSGADLVDVADTFLTITDEQPRATAEVSVRLLSFESTVKLA